MLADGDNIERWFKEGETAAAGDAAKIVADNPISDRQHSRCPHKGVALHWWTRGYAYQARLLRAIAAEGILQACSETAKLIQSEVRAYLEPG
jgi:hypothetical protein